MDRVVGRTAVFGARLASLFAWIALVALAAGSAWAEGRVVRIGTTNALKDSGVVDFLLEGFVAKSGYSVRVSAREIGAVVVRARKGEVDVVLSDLLSAEEALEKEGVVTRRTPFMESRFVIVGPKVDPAHIAGVARPDAALGQILRFHSPFVTRGDESAAHVRERELMRSAGLDPDGRLDGVFRTGTSMRDSLRVASQRKAYILADLGSYLAMKNELDLVVLSKPAKSLQIVESILQLDSTRSVGPIELEGAKALEKYLLSPEAQAKIAAFGVDRFGEAPFSPTSLP